MAKDAVDLPLGNHEFMYMVAAIIGSMFNPWMIFYQQSAIADKKLQPDRSAAARWDTAIGAVLTQCLTGAVLVAAAATLGLRRRVGGPRQRRRDQRRADAASRRDFRPAGVQRRRARRFAGGGDRLFAGVGLGRGEVAGYRRSLEYHPFAASWFYGVYAAAVVGAAALVWFVPDLVRLKIAAQVLNAFLLPLVIGLLVALGGDGAAAGGCARAASICGLLVGVSALVIALGLYGAVSGLL